MIKGGDNDSIHTQVIDRGHGRRGEADPRNRRLQRHRHPRPDRRRRAVGQDGDDREQRRRLVLRRDRRRSDRLRLGRLRRLDDADEDALRRWAGDGRHLPGADLGQRDAAWEEIESEHAAENASEESAGAARARPLAPGTLRPKHTGTKNEARPRAGRGSRAAEPAPEEAPEAARSRARSRAERGDRFNPGSGRPSGAALSRPVAGFDQVRAARQAEAPRPLDRFGDPDAAEPVTTSPCRRSLAATARTGRARGRPPFCARPTPSASVSLPGPDAELAVGATAARRRASPPGRRRLERTDQHRRRLALAARRRS